jgi:hypothetical protein
MDAGEVNIKEIIYMSRMTYSVLKEDMKLDECGWSNLSYIPGQHRHHRNSEDKWHGSSKAKAAR